MPVKYTHNKFYLMFNHACLITTETSEQAGNVGRTSQTQGCSRRIHEPWVPCDRLPFFLGNFILSFKNPKGKTLMPSHIFMYLFIYIYICIYMNEWCVYIVLCVLLYTQGACSIHLDDATAATVQRHQYAHHTPATYIYIYIYIRGGHRLIFLI